MGFTECLTLLFICLKINNIISWSWWWVLLPEILMSVVYLVMIYSMARSSRLADEMFEELLAQEEEDKDE